MSTQNFLANLPKLPSRWDGFTIEEYTEFKVNTQEIWPLAGLLAESVVIIDLITASVMNTLEDDFDTTGELLSNEGDTIEDLGALPSYIRGLNEFEWKLVKL
jgi:hypothetical protein